MGKKARQMMAEDERRNREAYIRMGQVQLTDEDDDT